MALFGSFNSLVSGGLAALGGNLGGFSGAALTQLAGGIAARPTVSIASGPVIGGGEPVLTASGGTSQVLIRGAAVGVLTLSKMARAVLKPILDKIAAKVGRPVSAKWALTMARRVGRVMEPAAIATALGITTAELAQLILHRAPSRRMNPANVAALRRSVRRLESFHKLCSRVDVLRRRGARPSGPRSFGGRRKKRVCR